MRIGQQKARKIGNYEINVKQSNEDLRLRLDEIESLLRVAVGSGELDDTAADDIDTAAREVVAAATEPTPHRPRILRAVEVLKNLSAATASTAGIAEAVDQMVHLATGR